MKKRALLFLAIIGFMSCNVDDDQGTQLKFASTREITPLQNLNDLEEGDTLAIQVQYANPSDCHSFNSFTITGTATEPNIIVVTGTEEEDCELIEATVLSSTIFNFVIGNSSSYVLRFWQEDKATGEEQFLRLDIPVVSAQ